MPSFLEYTAEKKALPPCLTASLAAYIAFYSSGIRELNEKGLVCRRLKGNEYTVNDDRDVLEFYWNHRADSEEDLVRAVLANTDLWGQDLTEVPELEQAVIRLLKTIRQDGALAAFRSCL